MTWEYCNAPVRLPAPCSFGLIGPIGPTGPISPIWGLRHLPPSPCNRSILTDLTTLPPGECFFPHPGGCPTIQRRSANLGLMYESCPAFRAAECDNTREGFVVPSST